MARPSPKRVLQPAGAKQQDGPKGSKAKAPKGKDPKAEGPKVKKAPRTKVEQPIEHRLLITATFCLLAGGAVMVYSASSARTLLQGEGDGTLYLLKYVVYGALGLGLMHVLSRHGLRNVRRYTPLFLAGTVVLLLLVMVPGIGVEINGARRWLGAGPLQFQPSELAKLAVVLHIALVIAARPNIADDLRGVAKPVIVVVGAVAVLIAIHDLGTALVLGGTTAMMLVAAGLPIRQLGLLAAAAGVLVLGFALLEPYRVARLTSFMNPWADASTTGFQSVQGQIAIGSGGLLGVGPGQSVQKVFYLPEAHTDFILAVIGEELGLAGIVGLLFLYGLIAYAGLRTAKNAKGLYAKLLATGITSLILCQALLNVYTVLGLAPLTGVPLPFISSGSSSLITLLLGMGVLLNVASGGAAHWQEVRHERAGAGAGRGRGDGRARGAGDRDRRRAAS